MGSLHRVPVSTPSAAPRIKPWSEGWRELDVTPESYGQLSIFVQELQGALQVLASLQPKGKSKAASCIQLNQQD